MMFRMLLRSLQGLFKVCTCIKLRKNWTVFFLHFTKLLLCDILLCKM